MSNPYKNLPDTQFWKRSVSNVSINELDPVGTPKFCISPDMKVSTAGSCFAQHIARVLDRSGFNYLITEPGLEVPEDERSAKGYGLFTARYGNIYTVTQLRQLLLEAYGLRTPVEEYWRRSDGKLADPFRPNIEPEGFESWEALSADRKLHLEAVRQMVETSDVFMFTLGLTEAWRSRMDGSVFPLVPGAAAGEFSPAEHEYHNYDVMEVIRDLYEAMSFIKNRNPKLKVVVTVSPVPLIATYESQHVLTSTTYSKSVLRVAAEELRKTFSWVDYFPSYEVITGNFNSGRYYDDDLREVNALGVNHAMKLFMRHFAERPANGSASSVPMRGAVGDDGVLCDENMLDSVKA